MSSIDIQSAVSVLLLQEVSIAGRTATGARRGLRIRRVQTFAVKPSQAQELLFPSIVDTHFPWPVRKSLGWWSVGIGCGIGDTGSPQLYRLGLGVVVCMRYSDPFDQPPCDQRDEREWKSGKISGRHGTTFFSHFFPSFEILAQNHTKPIRQ